MSEVAAAPSRSATSHPLLSEPSCPRSSRPRDLPPVEGRRGAGRRRRALLPTLEKVDDYLDWRVAIAANRAAIHPDFDDAALIVLEAWERVVGHVEEAWQEHLLLA